DVGIAVLEPGIRREMRARVVDRATARQREGQRVAVEGGDDGRSRRGRQQDRPPDADGDTRGLRQVVPERANGRVLVAPHPNDGLHLGIAATVIARNAPPGSGATAESAGELGAFSELPLGRGDLANGIVLLQHPVPSTRYRSRFLSPAASKRRKFSNFHVSPANQAVTLDSIELKSAQMRTCPGVAHSAARDIPLTTLSGLPKRASSGRSPAIIALISEDGSSASLRGRLCNCAPTEDHLPGPAP